MTIIFLDNEPHAISPTSPVLNVAIIRIIKTKDYIKGYIFIDSHNSFFLYIIILK